MREEWPRDIQHGASLLEARIRAAFKGVSREGGVSWSETRVVDRYGTPEEREAARSLDKDQSWEEVVPNAHWSDASGAPGLGGYPFLDAIGTRYYTPVSMVKSLRDDGGYSGGLHLLIYQPGHNLRSHCLSKFSLFNRPQLSTVAAYLRFWMKVNRRTNNLRGYRYHQEALVSYWAQFEDRNPTV